MIHTPDFAKNEQTELSWVTKNLSIASAVSCNSSHDSHLNLHNNSPAAVICIVCWLLIYSADSTTSFETIILDAGSCSSYNILLKQTES
jgi:hypothetical protein